MSPRAKSWKMLPLTKRYSCCCPQMVLSPVILHRLFPGWFRLWKIIGNAAQRIKLLLFSPKMQPLTELLLIVQAGPFIPLFGLFGRILSFMMGAAEPPPTPNYSEVSAAFSQAIPFLHTSPVSLPSFSPTSGSARKEHSVVAPWRENGRIHPSLWRW